MSNTPLAPSSCPRSRAARTARVTASITYRIVHPDSGETDATLTGTGEHPLHSPDVGGFVPIAELRVGDALSLSDPVATAYVTDIRVERGPPSDGTIGWPPKNAPDAAHRFTTYNFEVARWHTYFVSPPAVDDGAATGVQESAAGAVSPPPGVWVHNAGRAACELAAGVIAQVRRDNPTFDHWDVFVRALEKTNSPGARRTFDQAMPNTVEALMDAMYRAAAPSNGPVDLSRVKSWREINQFRRNHTVGHRITREYDFEIHHTATKQWTSRLLQDLPGYENLTEAQWKALFDDMPGLILNKHHHTNHGQGVSNIHDIIKAHMTGIDPNAPINPGDVMTRLGQAYTDWDSDLGPKVWAVARQWLQDKGVQ